MTDWVLCRQALLRLYCPGAVASVCIYNAGNHFPWFHLSLLLLWLLVAAPFVTYIPQARLCLAFVHRVDHR